MPVTDAVVESAKYPVGRFKAGPAGTAEQRQAWVETIAAAPAEFARLVAGLTDAQKATPYRDGGWTIAQVVHHVADSHLNAYARCRWALTETDFTVKPYKQALWAEFADATSLDVTPSLDMLRGLHQRWVTLLRAMSPAQWDTKLMHPENGPMTLDSLIQLYAWHSKHHAAHVRNAKQQHGWQ